MATRRPDQSWISGGRGLGVVLDTLSDSPICALFVILLESKQEQDYLSSLQTSGLWINSVNRRCRSGCKRGRCVVMAQSNQIESPGKKAGEEKKRTIPKEYNAKWKSYLFIFLSSLISKLTEENVHENSGCTFKVTV